MSELNFLEKNVESAVIVRVGKRGQKPLGYQVHINFKPPVENRKVIISADDIHSARNKAILYIRTGKFKQGNFYLKSTGLANKAKV